MDKIRDLLVEVGTEELPPTSLKRLSDAFANGFREQLMQYGLEFSGITPFATPRRLALLVEDLPAQQPDQEIKRKGPALRAAFDAQGQPTKAATGFAKSCNVAVEKLDREESEKGSWLVYRQVQRGGKTVDLIVDMMKKALDALPIPKRMRWGDQEDEFVRPVHWATIVFGTEAVGGRIFGVDSGGSTRGHRFHHPEPITIPVAAAYAGVLREQGQVEPSFDERREIIRSQVNRLAMEAGGKPLLRENLLEEVTALCEWPYAILGTFDEGFLEVPREVLIETMQKHQKYFPVISENEKLLPRFITISNICSQDPDQVRAGNERVIRPRFSDAAFFWQQDLKHPLHEIAPKLDKVVFHEQLGTLADKTARVARLSAYIAALLGLDASLARRSAELAKCDLLTRMVVEFPGLQGTMGRYYAEKDGEDPCVVSAMEQQYFPRYAGDKLPESDCGLVLSLSDKLDTLVGIFAIGERPTGIKDPYALRRATIGLLRIVIETPLRLDLKDVLKFTAEGLRDKVNANEAALEVFAYSMERLKGYYKDKGVRGDVVDSVLATHPGSPNDIHLRIFALKEFLNSPGAGSLTAANKRIRNILQKNGHEASGEVDRSLLHVDEEKRLLEVLVTLEAKILPFLRAQDYKEVLQSLGGLDRGINAFFDQVMVMDDNPQIRGNRLALLRALETLFLKVADMSLLK